MPNPHADEFRVRVVAAYEAGEGSYVTIAERFGIGEATVRRWVKLYRRTQSVTPLAKGGGNHSSITAEALEALLDEMRDATAVELTAAFNRGKKGKARVHVSSLKRALHRYGYVLKKNEDVPSKRFDQTWSLDAKST